MEQNIKRTDKVVNKPVDEWIDGQGYFHRKVIKETITGPLTTEEASRISEKPLLHRIMIPLFNRRGLGMPRQVNVGGSMFQPQQPQQFQQPRPQMDFGAMMKLGKKLMDDLGIDPKDLIKDIFSEDKSILSEGEDKDIRDSKTDQKEVKKTWQKKTKQQKQRKQLKTQKTKKIQKTQNKSK